MDRAARDFARPLTTGPGCRESLPSRPPDGTSPARIEAPQSSQKEIPVIEGTLLTESLRVGTSLENLNLTVRKISRYQVPDPAPSQPGIWCALDFEADDADAEALARTFAGALDRPGWY